MTVCVCIAFHQTMISMPIPPMLTNDCALPLGSRRIGRGFLEMIAGKDSDINRTCRDFIMLEKQTLISVRVESREGVTEQGLELEFLDNIQLPPATPPLCQECRPPLCQTTCLSHFQCSDALSKNCIPERTPMSRNIAIPF